IFLKLFAVCYRKAGHLVNPAVNIINFTLLFICSFPFTLCFLVLDVNTLCQLFQLSLSFIQSSISLAFRDVKLADRALRYKCDNMVEAARSVLISREAFNEVRNFVDHRIVGGRVVTGDAEKLKIQCKYGFYYDTMNYRPF